MPPPTVFPSLHPTLTIAVVGLALTCGLARAEAPNGSYECWYFSSPRAGLNFKLAGESYTDSEGTTGAVQRTGGVFAFQGAGLDGVKARFRGGNPPSFSILGPRGDEVSVCQLAR